VEDDLLFLADQEMGAEARWNRPRKRRISLRVNAEVVDWFKSKGPGYQTRINRILRRVMMEGKKRMGGKVEVRNPTLPTVCLPHSIAKNERD
jgi:BrnA antitoxin of type II toxin-antitoxin system